MLGTLLDKTVTPVAWTLERNHMNLLGTASTKRLAQRYSRLRHGRAHEFRRRQFLDHLDELLQENGPIVGEAPEMVDGWAIDRSGTLPHLDRIVADGQRIVEERGGVKRETWGKPFIQDLWTHDLVERFGSFLDFASSSPVVAAISRYLGFVPALSGALPPGVRLVESDARFDEAFDGKTYRHSQLHHLDYHGSPMVYVVVALRDITPESGPLCFLPASVSDRAAAALRYGSRETPYRLTDEVLYEVADESELIRFAEPAGTVLFIDSSRCFHYGSRYPVNPRYQLMYAYMSPCRSDFSGVLRALSDYPVRPGDSTLRKMVLDRSTPG